LVEDWLKSLDHEACSPLLVAGGEEAKNDSQVVDLVLEAINTNKLCRKACVLVIGGGAVLDAVGYATSIAHRGLRIIRMPTTTLSACDSGVGVKNAINHFGKKNFIGVFDPPYAVINDLSLLSTLDDRHWRSGLSEAIKVALVKDEKFFDHIESNVHQLVSRDAETMANIVTTSATLHLRHITEGGDPFERLDARPLDFGHWAAHKLEQLTQFELTHGEAVAIGLAVDLRCSVILGHLDEAVARRAINLLQSLGFSTSHPAMEDPSLLDGIEEFREHLGGKLTILMLKGIGDPIDVHALRDEIVRQAINELV
jgi:3-dehydroquinate synthase